MKRSFKLNSGYIMPAVGLGTWQSKPIEVKKAVEIALRAGYRHIDAAKSYGNEHEVGDGIEASGVLREEIFLTGKLWNTDHKSQDVERALDNTLRDLGTDYLDLFLVHWPVAFQSSREKYPINPKTGEVHIIDVPLKNTWAAMEALVSKGKVRSIGVSNFTRVKIEEILKTANIPPAVNQIEAHIHLQQRHLLEWCKQQNILVVAYSPLGNNSHNLPKAVHHPDVLAIAKLLNREPAQVLISWAIQRGTAVLPKSVTPHRIEDNLKDFVLPAYVFEHLNTLDKHRRYNFPARLGLDIFDEVSQESLRRSVEEWKASQLIRIS